MFAPAEDGGDRTTYMNPGYVYILVNPSLPGCVKIGRTLRDSRARARELFTSGLPTPFQVAFEIFSECHDELEAAIHVELRDFRITDNREFFRYPLDKAIALLQQMNSPSKSSESSFVAEDITQLLKAKYPRYLRPDIVAVRIVQVPDRVWLEVTEEREVAGYLRDQTIHRSDLAFIANSDDLFFRPQDNVQVNASKFVNDFDAYSIINTTNIFHEAGCKEVQLLFNANRPKEPEEASPRSSRLRGISKRG